MASERTKMIEESKVDPDEDIMTRGIRGALRGAMLGVSKAGDFVEKGVEDLKSSAKTVGDDIHMMLGTPRGKMKEEYLEKKYNRPEYNYQQRQKAEADAEMLRESRRGQAGYKKGGKVSSASKRADGIAQRGKTRGRMV
jgi:hypothetical protein